TVNQPGFYSVLMINGGSSQYTLTVTGAPTGLYVGVGGNMITFGGTPTAAGAFNNINLSIQDAAGATASGTYAITINAAPTLGALTLSQWTVGQSGYSGAIPISDGTGPLTLSAQVNLPTGLTAIRSGSTVTFTGTPTATGTFNNIQLTVQDAAGASST